MRINAGAVTEPDADKPKPARLDRGRGDIDLGAVDTDERSPLGLGQVELFALLIRHWRDRVEQAACILATGGASAAVRIAYSGCPFALVLQHVDCAIKICCDAPEYYHDAIHSAVVIFVD